MVSYSSMGFLVNHGHLIGLGRRTNAWLTAMYRNIYMEHF